MEDLPDTQPFFTESVKYRPSSVEVHEFVKNHYEGFSLKHIFFQLEILSAGWGFQWTKVSAEIASSGNLILSHEYDDSDIDDRPLLLKITLKLPVDGLKVVTHDEMILPHRLQQKGLSAELIKPYYEQYRKSGVDFIHILASDTGGGYVWAKYGFRAIYKKDLHGILARPETVAITSEVIGNLHLTITNFYKTRSDTVPFPIRAWTPFSFSKELLMGTTWHGILDLNDAEHRQFFEDYLCSRP